MYKKLLTVILSFFIFASLATPVLAQNANKLKGNECLYNGAVTLACIPPLFANAVYWLLILSGTVAVFLIAYGGIKYLTSSGEAKAVESARKIITWAIIGLIVILLSFGIVAAIAELTGVRCITKFGFTACKGSSTGDPAYDDCFGNNYGSCPGDLVCRYSSDATGAQCQTSLCSEEKNSSSKCPNGKTCQYDPNGTWSCK